MTTYENLKTCRNTILEMMHDRGYDISEFYDNKQNINQLTLNEIKSSYLENNLKILVKKQENDVCILFYNDKIGIEMMKEIINSKMKKEKFHHLILIIREKLTSFAKKELNNIPPKCQIEVFLQHNILFNATHHVKVPKHELIIDNDTHKNILEIYGKATLPKISKHDVISRYYNAKIGDIFKIYRHNTIFYRQVINDIDK